MKWIAEIKKPKHIRAEIKLKKLEDLITHQVVDGFYLYIYENNNKRCTWDYHYETLEGAKNHVLKDFQVPISAWTEANE